MDTRTLEQAFDAMFHDSAAYDEFCSLSIESEITELDLGLGNAFSTSPILKKYLRFIDKVILESLQKHGEAAHSYIKEKSALTALQAMRVASARVATKQKTTFILICTLPFPPSSPRVLSLSRRFYG